MGRGATCQTSSVSHLRSNRSSGTAAHAAKTSRAQALGDNQPFSATILKKLFPKAGQPEKDDGFTISIARHEETGEDISLKGKYGPASEGQLIQVKRYAWREDPRYGAHVQVFAVSHEDPISPQAIMHYLENLPGVGEVMASEIYSQLGKDCLEKIDKDPSILLTIKANGRGLKPESLQEIADTWDGLRADRKSMLQLTSLGLGDATAKRIISHFGGREAVEIIHDNPYRMTEADGVGFKIADTIAAKMGYGPKDPRRIAAGVEYLLDEAEGDGHICLTREQIKKRAPGLLSRNFQKPSDEEIEAGIEAMTQAGRLWTEVSDADGIERIYTTEHYLIETRLYEHLRGRLGGTPIRPPEDLKRREDEVLTEEQFGAVEKSFTEPISILTGGPGVGKTTAIRGVIDQLEARGQDVVLMAPTGKAAKRMAESTGRQATTIHRRLGFNGLTSPSSLAGQASGKQIEADVVIVDEASMLDMRLAERLFSHIDDDTRVVLVGDPDQLPAVGAGSVLHDLIESERVPTTRLTQIFRQAEDSLLIVNANRIKQGKDPYWTKEEAEQALGHSVKEDWEFIEVGSPKEALAKSIELAESLPKAMGLTDEEVMVTAGTKKGDAGVFALNQKLQALRNRDGFQIRGGEQPIRVGDIVMNTKNRYDKQGVSIMNGDMGRIAEYSAEKRTAYVEIDGDTHAFSGSDQLETLIPAYAATTHKLQGSEAPLVINPFCGSSEGSRILSRNLLYTSNTRAREKCIVVGDKETVRRALAIDGSKRQTTLDLKVGRIAPRIRARWEKVKKVQQNLGSATDLLYG